MLCFCGHTDILNKVLNRQFYFADHFVSVTWFYMFIYYLYPRHLRQGVHIHVYSFCLSIRSFVC